MRQAGPAGAGDDWRRTLVDHAKRHTYPGRVPTVWTEIQSYTPTDRFRSSPSASTCCSAPFHATMSTDDHDALDGEITTEAEFDATLERLLLTATSNGVNPEGAWEYRNGDGTPDFEVLVTELADDGASK